MSCISSAIVNFCHFLLIFDKIVVVSLVMYQDLLRSIKNHKKKELFDSTKNDPLQLGYILASLINGIKNTLRIIND